MKNALFFFLYCDIILIDVLERHMFIGGLHMIHKKIGAFIFQDVQNPNETKTTAVTLRLYALILSVYFLVLFLCLLLSSGCSFLPADAHLWHFICICFPDYLSKPYTFCFHFFTITDVIVDYCIYTEIWVGLRCTALPVCTSRIKFCSQFPPHTH